MVTFSGPVRAAETWENSREDAMTLRWEVRQMLRWGSRHERWFASEVEAKSCAENGAGDSGTWKRVENTFYFSPYPDEA